MQGRDCGINSCFDRPSMHTAAGEGTGLQPLERLTAMASLSKPANGIWNSRILSTRVLAAILFFFLFFTDHCWVEGGFIDTAFESLGLVLVTVSALGRLWSSMYIAGYKNGRLITEGPYSIVRNPLYVFSFIGAVGIGFSSERLVVLAVLVVGFLLYYPQVVSGEENYMRGVHGEAYTEYEARTPRFIPNPSLFREPDTYVVNAGAYRKTFYDTVFFILVFVAIEIIEKLHDAGILPVLFKTP